MKKLLVVFFFCFFTISLFAQKVPKTGEDWLTLTPTQKTYFIFGMLYTLERLDYTITTQFGDSKASEVKKIKEYTAVYAAGEKEIVDFLDKYFQKPMNQSMFIWDLLVDYDVYKDDL
jgi:hypothetical protein